MASRKKIEMGKYMKPNHYVGALRTFSAIATLITLAAVAGTKDAIETKGPYHPVIDPPNFSSAVNNP
jgi:hypothetical protein